MEILLILMKFREMSKAENVSDFCETEYRNTGTNFMFREIPKSLFLPRPILSPFRGSARIRTFYGKHEKTNRTVQNIQIEVPVYSKFCMSQVK